MFYAFAAVILFGLGHYAWRRSVARDRAELWLIHHQYRVRELRVPWFVNPARFPTHLFRSSRSAIEFRAVVDDRSFGGTGVVWLRVWTGMFGVLSDEDVEVSWERMPHPEPDDERPIDAKWSERQLALLRRIAAGETTFQITNHDPATGAQFDELVEYLLALQRRGLIAFGTPMANLSGGSQYEAVSNVVLTEAGERSLRQHDASGDAGSRAAS